VLVGPTEVREQVDLLEATHKEIEPGPAGQAVAGALDIGDCWGIRVWIGSWGGAPKG